MSDTHLAKRSYGNISEIVLRRLRFKADFSFQISRYTLMHQKKLSIYLVSLILFIFAVNYIAMKFYWYSAIWYFDMPMHLLGGFWLGFALIWLFRLKELSFKLIFKIILCVFLIGILWELFEIFVDKTIAQNPFNILDTISDMCFDLAGGGLSIIYFFKRIVYN